jgi:hypothetical protein
MATMSAGHTGLPDDTQEKLTTWCERCSQCLAETYDLCAPYVVNDAEYLHPLVRFVSAQLLISCHLTSESIFLLIANRKIWDADTLMRSVLEGTFKFAFLLDGRDQERIQKAQEYWITLPEMARTSCHRRASFLLEVFKNEKYELKRPFMDLTLSAEEEKTLRDMYPKLERQKLGQKWSFMKIANHFAQHPDEKYHGMAALAHSYGMQSHLLHQDGDGVGMIWDRSRRGPERRFSVEGAHAGRLISDICWFAFFRALQLFAAAKQPSNPIKNLTKRFEPLFAEIDRVRGAWHLIEYGPEAPRDEDGA